MSMSNFYICTLIYTYRYRNVFAGYKSVCLYWFIFAMFKSRFTILDGFNVVWFIFAYLRNYLSYINTFGWKKNVYF